MFKANKPINIAKPSVFFLKWGCIYLAAFPKAQRSRL